MCTLHNLMGPTVQFGQNRFCSSVHLRESRPTRSHSEVLAEGCVSVEEQGVPNQQQGIAEGEF